MKTRAKQQYVHRLKCWMLVTPEISIFTVPVLTYSFEALKRTCTDLEDIQRKTCIILSKNKHHDSKLSHYLHICQITNLRNSFLSKTSTSELHKIVKLAYKNLLLIKYPYLIGGFLPLVKLVINFCEANSNLWIAF